MTYIIQRRVILPASPSHKEPARESWADFTEQDAPNPSDAIETVSTDYRIDKENLRSVGIATKSK